MVGIERNQQLTATDVALNVANYIKPIAQAVKEIDPTIKVIGGELAWYDKGVYELLYPTSGLSDGKSVAGLIPSGPAAGLPYVDFLSFHLYLYEFGTDAGGSSGPDDNLVEPDLSGNTWERFQVYSEIEKYRRFHGENLGKRCRGIFREAMVRTNSITASSERGGFPLGWMCTEMNWSHYNEDNDTKNINGFDTRSMLGAQNYARMVSLAMEYNCTSALMWAVKEGTTTATEVDAADRGYLTVTTGLNVLHGITMISCPDYSKGNI